MNMLRARRLEINRRASWRRRPFKWWTENTAMRRKCWCGKIINGASQWKQHEQAHARDHQLGVIEDTMAFDMKREDQINAALGLDPDAALRASGMAEYEDA